ncbi:MAG: choice-of-anchor L domain-containing protein [Gelidibacter sp.]
MKNFYFFAAFLISLNIFSQDVFMQNGTFNRCAPDRLYDSGGGSANYVGNENYVTTICALNPGDFVILNFTSFNTQLNQDILTIYDGPDTSSPLIGAYSGGASFSPGMVSASPANTSGCLTLKFVSNATVNGTGFIADILCAEPCQTITSSIDSTTPPPNGSGVITIFPGGSVDFNGSATFSGDGTGATYTWNFADGSPVASGLSVSHIFNNPGTYNVTFTATDTNPQGCSDVVAITVLVLQPIVSINNSAYPESSYTPQQLIENVLVSGGCSAVDNFSFQVNGAASNLQGKSYGYFNKGGAVNFPFEEGIVLSTGRAFAAGNTINGTLVSFDNNDPGDADLEAALSQTNTNDATFIKFNFVPTSDTISFRYLMASEEYDGSTECSFADSFAFLLREVGTLAYTNLAVLPNGTPVSVTNINNSGVCTANPSFFQGYNIGDTNYGGRTVVLTAVANVTLGLTYEIKLVVADQGDSIWDSAIFLEAGSFNLGGELGDDITIASGNAQCNGGMVTLDTQAPNATHVWYKDGVVIAGQSGPTLDVTEAGTYSVDVIFAPTCQTSDSILVEFYPDIVIDSVQDLFLCNPGAPPYNFDLTENNSLILGSITDTTNYIITYYESQADADADTNSITNPSTYPGINGQTVYVRLEYLNSGCYDTAAFTLNIIAQPTINPVSDLAVCDDFSNDGFEQFDLELQTTTILGSQPSANFAVTYYANFADADSDSNPLVSPYVNTINPQPIYVRLENTGNANCTTISTNPVFNLVVNDRALANQPNDLFVCDDMSNDGLGQFNLLQQNTTILGSQLPMDYSVSYYETQIDAETANNPIPNPVNYSNSSNPQTIFVRVSENSTPDCYGFTTFQLEVSSLPSLVPPTALEVCDDNVPDGFTSMDLSVKDAEVTGGNPQYAVSYHLDQASADSGTGPLPVPYTNVLNPQTVYVRVVDTSTGCYATTTLELHVEQAPVAFVPPPLEYCDADSDGFGVFDLGDADAQITGGIPGLTVTYHETLADAENNVNAQGSPYSNIVAHAQTLFARVESATVATDCATIVPLQLIVNDTPQIEAPSPLEVCDDNADGFAQFDLTAKDAEILNGLDASRYAVSYYEQQLDAETPVNAIASPNAYTNATAFSQVLWVRVDDTVNGCHKLTTLELAVNALPSLAQPSALELCDVNDPGDEMEAFTLEDANAEILNGQTGISLSYYATQADADSGTNPISSPYVNTSNAQTIYVRAETSSTGCVSTITLDLRVNPVPSLSAPPPLRECDADNDGFASFDLEARTLQIINGETDIHVTYHETMADADSGQNALLSPYNNIVANSQTVFVRKEKALTGCYRVVLLVLETMPSPVVPTDIADYVVCDTDGDGQAQFDLSTKDAEVLGGQPPLQYVLTYHTSQADADTGANPIANVAGYTNMSNPQTIYVRLEGVGNGCAKTGQFEIRVELPPTAVQPAPLDLCDDSVADEMTVFDLTVKDNEITGGNGSWSVGYYVTNADAQAGTNVIDPATAYTNVSVGGNAANPQTLYVRVTDTDTGCTDFTTLTIRVLPNPTPSLDPSDIELCDDISTGDGREVFDLTVNEAYIINGELGVSATYHETLGDAESGANAIADPTMYTNANPDNEPQTIYVRVENDVTGCYTIVEFGITVNPLPEVVAVSDYVLCEVGTDGFAEFDLASKDSEVLNGQDPSRFTVSYHATQSGSDNLTGALLSPYTNTSNPQQIFVAITDTVTGCSISTQSFNIEVDNGAEANSDMDPIVQATCDYLGANDGLAQFDLTGNNAEVLDGQDATGFTVTYYFSEADAELGVNPIPDLYENISNPQTVYVRVDNDEPDAAGMDGSICYAVTELTLRVDLRPIFDLGDIYTLCVGTNGTEVIAPPVLDTGLSGTDYAFEWTLDGALLTGETGPALSASQSGTYMVTVTNAVTGCSESDSAEVVDSSPPGLTVEVATQAFSESHVIVATATGDGEYEYSLDGGPWQASGTFEGVSLGEHTVVARDTNGCGEAEGTVVVLDYPHFFTPNGDGDHETWNIVGFAGQPSAKIYIFDRFGKLLKQISPSGRGWDGTYNGRPMPSSDYWFTVEYSEPSTGEPKQFRAHFTLKR